MPWFSPTKTIGGKSAHYNPCCDKAASVVFKYGHYT